MRCVIQRVSQASVSVEGETIGSIGRGLCALVGVSQRDGPEDAAWLAEKVVTARVFEDDAGKMNRSLVDVEGALLAISQFTLLGDLRKGRRPSFNLALGPEQAVELFEAFCRCCSSSVPVHKGRFRAQMRVSLVNEGPVTLLLDSKKAF